MQGPNVKKLIIYKMSEIMVPPGGGLAEALKSLSSAKNMGEIARKATQWVEAAIAIVKTVPDNPYGDDDEAIAGEILRRIDEKKGLKNEV